MGSMEEFIHYANLIIVKRRLADPSITDEQRRMLARLLALGSETLSRKGRRVTLIVYARRSTPHRSASDKAALEYLALCGAVPISVIERDGMCSTIRCPRRHEEYLARHLARFRPLGARRPRHQAGSPAGAPLSSAARDQLRCKAL